MRAAGLVTALLAAEVLGMAGFSTVAALLPDFIALWRLTNTEAGWLNGILFAGYMAAVPPLVSLTDRADPRRIYLAAMALTAASSALFALAADGLWSALALRALAGVGLAGTYMPGLKLLADRIHGPRRSRAFAVYTAGFSIGAAFSFWLAGAAAALGWRGTFALAAGCAAAAVLIVLIAVPRGATAAAPESALLDFRPVLRERRVMGYVVAYGAHVWELFGQRSWIVAFLVFAASLDRAAWEGAWPATVVAAVMNLCGVPASILGNELALRLGRVRVAVTIGAAAAALSATIGFLAGLPPPLLIALCFAHAALTYGDSATVTAGAVEAAPVHLRGATMAVHSGFGFACGVLGPLAFGIVLDLAGDRAASGWGLAFASLGAAALVGPVALLAASRAGARRDRPRSDA